MLAAVVVEYLIAMAIMLWATVRSMVRLSLGGYDSLYGYPASTDTWTLALPELTEKRSIPARV